MLQKILEFGKYASGSKNFNKKYLNFSFQSKNTSKTKRIDSAIILMGVKQSEK